MSGRARVALILGATVSPIFFISVFIQAATRPGYSLNRVPLSLLSLGDGGWVQITDFIVCGGLALVGAIGIRVALTGQRGRAALTVLSALFGLGLIVAGIFHPDPAAGFPPGTSAPAVMSTHNALHETGFFLVNVSLVVCCFVFASLFRRWGQRGWAWYGVASGVVGIVLVVGGIASSNFLGTTVGGVVVYSFLSLVSGRLAYLTSKHTASRPVDERHEA